MQIQCLRPGFDNRRGRAGEPTPVGKSVRSRLHLRILTTVIGTGLAFGAGAVQAEEQVEVPALTFPVELDSQGLAAQSAIADCRLAETIIQSGEHLQGLLIFETCIEELRDIKTQAHYLHFRGTTLDRIGVDSRAVADLERAVQLEPKSIDYALSLGQAWLKREDYDKALALFRGTLRLSPNDADVLSGIGSSWLQLGDLPRASAFIQRALDIEPDHALALRDRGLIFLLENAADRAFEDFDRAITSAPELWDLFLYRGIANFHGARIEAALEDFNQADKLHPDNPRILVNRGELLGQTGRTQEAFADFAAAIDINPGTVEAWYGRGLLGARIAGDDPEMMKQARSDLKQAITLDPGNARLEAAMSILHPAEPEEDKRRF